MWKVVLLAVCLLANEVHTMDNPVYGVKLCGREFIRAVIFTCGGSRWRRSLRTSAEDLFSAHQDSSGELSHNPVMESKRYRNRDLDILSSENQERIFSRPTRSFITEEILEALRKADRKGREVVLGLSNACCKWGCSKSEISSLC
ncbi:relaxin-3a isoform X1 [Phycodurus eques]|uniref:relaxin-3a isoform X1 n=1 Tax=Phycodurus eques TaxID=693459 RepID=UPI002ACE1A8C|nr:relaxin-3a isoform X1 [Phycodurus eques]